MTENSNLVVIAQKKIDSRSDFSAIYSRKSGNRAVGHTRRLPKYGDETYSFIVDWQMPGLEPNKKQKSKSSIKVKHFQVL
jgi:hypothetical protein